MHKGRVEAFSDAVIAIIIMIMVLELRVPEGGDSWNALLPLYPIFLSYVLSFLYLGIYWNNHHHMFQAVGHVNGAVLWANLHILFWLSLTPFVTRWMGEKNDFAPAPMALYGVVLLCCALAYYVLERTLIAAQGASSQLAIAVGAEIKGWISTACYAVGVVVALLWTPWVALALYTFVGLMWLVPDRRIERALNLRK